MSYSNAKRSFGSRLFILSAILLCLAAVARAQTQEKEDVVRVETELVQTDVMVFDKEGKFVDGLTREQFELRVDGRPVPLAFFERVSAPLPKGVAAPGATAAAANAAIASRARGRTIIFFVDDLHLSLDSLNPTRAAITHFIDEEMVPGDLAAIVTASGQLGFLQQFTDNKAVLRAAVARLKNIPYIVGDGEQPPMSDYIATRIANGDRQAAGFYITKIQEGVYSKSAAAAGMGGGANNVNGIFEMVKMRATNITKQMESVTNGSLSALEKLVQMAGQIEGRKLIFFVSDGFYLDGKNSASTANRRLQLVTDSAARTGSVVYSIDARGLFAPFHDASGSKARDPNGFLDRSSVGEATLAQDGLANLAGETGGQFLKNQNYFDHWVSRVLDETSNYYRIAWKPENEEQKGARFKRVEVAVAGRPDLTVRLHRGYVPAAVRAAEESKGDKAGAKPDAKSATPKAAEAKGAEADFRAAFTAPAGKHGLPTALSTSYVDVPDKGAVLTAAVEVRTAALDYGADGKQPASVDMVGVVLNDQGKQVSNFSKRLTVAPSAPSASGSGEQPGVIYNHRAPLTPGLYQVKAAARDSRGGQLGSAVQWIEIPDLSKKQLTLSSLHLGGRQVGGGGADGSAPQIQFSVNRQFSRSSKVDFLGFVYNAARAGGGAGAVDLSVTLRVLRDNKAVVSSPSRKLAPEAGADLARIPVTGAISLGQLPAGRYELEVGVSDNVARTNAVERIVFEIK